MEKKLQTTNQYIKAIIFPKKMCDFHWNLMKNIDLGVPNANAPRISSAPWELHHNELLRENPPAPMVTDGDNIWGSTLW